MTEYAGGAEANIALERIRAAFADRARPAVLTDSKQLSDQEHAEVTSYGGIRWQDVAFSHEAFCYYLSGFLAAGLNEGRTDSNAYDALIGMLDRSPMPDYWDDFFLPRWTLLNAAEIDAVAAWVLWLQVVEPDAFHSNTYDRVLGTSRLLEKRQRGA